MFCYYLYKIYGLNTMSFTSFIHLVFSFIYNL